MTGVGEWKQKGQRLNDGRSRQRTEFSAIFLNLSETSLDLSGNWLNIGCHRFSVSVR